MNRISNNPPRGTYDWFPEEFEIRKYIFDTWRRVCTSFGYEEYLTPLVEDADIYRAKSGEDVGGEELTVFEDSSGKELAIRPEMTPSVTRMMSRKINELPKPIRYFSIANFYRGQKPQKGRNREFWQLNYDIFGDNSLNADIEVLQLALEIMLAFNPPQDSFKLYLNNRKLVDYILESKVKSRKSKVEIIRILDKLDKISKDEVEKRLLDLGVEEDMVSDLYEIFSSEDEELFIREFPDLEENAAYKETLKIMSFLESLGYGEYIEFKPNLMRGFDYYDGMVFEVFDMNEDNKRSLFGGGRYNGLAQIFGVENFPAVGGAPGDETLKIFLEEWGLLKNIKDNMDEKTYYLPVLDQKLAVKTLDLARKLRHSGKNVIQNLSSQGLSKSLDTANQREYDYVVIFGEYENNDDVYKVKDMKSGEENSFPLDLKIEV